MDPLILTIILFLLNLYLNIIFLDLFNFVSLIKLKKFEDTS